MPSRSVFPQRIRRRQIQPLIKDKARPRLSDSDLRLLSTIGASLVCAEDPLQLARTTFRTLVSNLDLDVCLLYLPCAADGLRLDSYAGIDETVAKDIEFLKAVDAPAGSALGASEYIGSGYADMSPSVKRSMGLQASLCHPLRTDKELLGAVAFGMRRRARFQQGYREILRIVCDQLSVALSRERVALSLRNAERRLKIAMECGGLGLFDWSVATNEGWFGGSPLFGLRDRSLTHEDHQRFLELVHPLDRERVTQAISRCLAGSEPLDIQCRMICPGDRVYWLACQGRALRDESGGVVSVTGIAMDVSKRRQLEEKASCAQLQVRELCSRIESIREDERRRIAQTVHDDLGQVMTALKMHLWRLEQTLPRTDTVACERARSMSELIDRTIGAVQRIAVELRPGVLDDLGLMAAIEWLTKDFQRSTGLKCKFPHPALPIRIEREAATAVFRIVQEALTNVARHAAATVVTLDAAEHRGNFVLRIRDNGKGFEPEASPKHNALGIVAMLERAIHVGGVVSVRSAPGKGTTVRIRVPAGVPTTGRCL